jgi:hypothetical protein
MGDLLKLIWYAVAGLFRSRAALQTEVLVLRRQLNVLRRSAPKRVAISNIDRLVFAGLYRLAPEHPVGATYRLTDKGPQWLEGVRSLSNLSLLPYGQNIDPRLLFKEIEAR